MTIPSYAVREQDGDVHVFNHGHDFRRWPLGLRREAHAHWPWFAPQRPGPPVSFCGGVVFYVADVADDRALTFVDELVSWGLRFSPNQ